MVGGDFGLGVLVGGGCDQRQLGQVLGLPGARSGRSASLRGSVGMVASLVGAVLTVERGGRSGVLAGPRSLPEPPPALSLADGEGVGVPDGDGVGVGLAEFVGEGVGDGLGVREGSSDGSSLGSSVGLSVGSSEGSSVGEGSGSVTVTVHGFDSTSFTWLSSTPWQPASGAGA
ncbi:hypothetical protein KGD82_01805 [Nocardiopsis eucommiae]|uniref:Uncharacterized protein n=1 Tax=Nocardiopsis eucommiae TaxID=2831970 RepID=A0A975L9W0_9ACTN|nr:hypothetical protein KGD82_01805 [Nocardiopsis eucommiae]